MAWWILFFIGLILFTLWIVSVPSVIWFIRDHRLPLKSRDLPDPSLWPFVSVIVPARDEEGNIEACLRSLLQMDYLNFEVIAVDDRSRDRTGTIMDRLAAEDERLKIIHVRDLPSRWIGKNHAMWSGAKEAAGKFLLFTDGDVIFEKEALKEAMRYIAHEELDHLCLIPQLVPGGYVENALTNLIGLLFVIGMNPRKISSSSKKHYGGVGAFNLVRRKAYNDIGGHEAISLEVVDDIKIGKTLKEKGFSQDMLVGSDLIKVKWHEGALGLVRGLEKNLFAVFEYSLKKLVFFNLVYIWYLVLPFVGLISLRDARVFGYAMAVLVMLALYGYTASRVRYGLRVLPALPAVILLYWWAIWRSAIVTLREGGVSWRDTFYPLEILRPEG